MGIKRTRLGKTLALPIRRVDGSGRVTMPDRMRRALGITPDTPVTFELVGDAIIMRRDGKPGCPHCGGTGLAEFVEEV